MRRILVLMSLLVVAALAVTLGPARALATAGDLLPAGAAYEAYTYAGHPNYFSATNMYNTCDLNYREGTAVRAPENGTIAQVSSGWGGGWGNGIVWTSANGSEKLHMSHLSSVVKTGAVVAGDIVAYSGNTGNSSGAHLHIDRAVNGAVAPVVLSGRTIVPAVFPAHTDCTSNGPVSGGVPRFNPIAPGDAGFTKGGTAAYWWSSGAGAFGTGLYSYCNGGVRDCWGRWTFDLSKLSGTANYKVEAYIPNNHATTGNARYRVNTASGLQYKSVNQNALYNVWTDLGTYTLNAGSAWIELDDATGETYANASSPKIGFDAIRLTYVSPITQPANLSVVGGVTLSLPPYTVGSTLSGSVMVKNAGGLTGTWAPLVLALRGPGGENRDAVAAASITLAAGESKVVTFSRQLDLTGNWTGFVSGQLASGSWQSPAGAAVALVVTTPPDTTPPQTTSDRAAYYAASATVNMTAVDTGGSGVAHTYYTLNGFPPVEGSTVTVGGANTYTLTYWSEDTAGNTESPHTVTFTVVATPSSAGIPSTPSFISSLRHGRSFTVAGYVSRHTSGTYPVSLRFYRYRSGRWVYYKSTSARVSTILTFSRYSDSTSVGYAGKWRVRARHRVGSHYRYSNYRYFSAS